MKTKWMLGIILGAMLSACCSVSNTQPVSEKEDTTAKQLLQGLWMDDVTSDPIFRIQGDTIYYTDASIAPVSFKVIKDSLKTYGSQTTSYHIKKQNDYSFWIQSTLGDILQLRKAETAADSINFEQPDELHSTESQAVMMKDKVVYYNQVRYRGYAYINPSSIKVYQPTLSEEGLEVDNIYYDNIIHICVYEGKNELFAKDIRKQDFSGLIPDDFCQRAILSDMDFVNVNARGYHYQATLCIPNAASCYLINLYVSFNGEITYELAE